MTQAAAQITTAPATPQGLVHLTARSVVIAIILTIAIFVGITRVGFIQINWVPYMVPPVPAMLFLLILTGLNAFLTRTGLGDRLTAAFKPLSRGELLMIYAGMCVALAMERGGYVIHYLLTAKYFATEVNGWENFFNFYPQYWVPQDNRIILQWFETSPDGQVPWSYWWPFLAWWGGFSLLLIAAMMSISAFFRRQWTESERLTYPLLFLPIEMTGGLDSKSGGMSASVASGFFSNKLMWIGFGLATAFNLLNILHSFFPGMPQIRTTIPLDENLTDPPWRYLRPISLSMALEVWGLGYLVSGEVLLSTWLFYWFIKIVKLIGLSAGYRAVGFPFYQELSAGGCIAVAGFLMYVARPHFRQVWRDILKGPNQHDANEAMPFRYLAIVFLASTVGMVYMLTTAGIPLTLVIFFFAVLYMFVLVAARIRAEVGPPVTWTVPYGFDTIVPQHFLGTRSMQHMLGPQGFVLYNALFFIGRTVFAHATAQYFTDGLRLADVGHVRRRSINSMMIITCVVGLALAYWFHLDVGYKYGQGLIGAKIGRAGTGWAMSWSKGNYNLIRNALDKPTGPDFLRLAFYAAGFLFTTGLTLARTHLTAFPLHPLGFVMATLYGDHSPYWFPFFVAWLAQRLALRYGGLPLYRKTVPIFLGLVLGHVLVGGVIWRIIINYFIDPVISSRYYVNLGG
ncbi:MAG: DUF6785 family protein [Armatimonadia bacterium]